MQWQPWLGSYTDPQAPNALQQFAHDRESQADSQAKPRCTVRDGCAHAATAPKLSAAAHTKPNTPLRILNLDSMAASQREGG
jgi:hypothetical protein